MGKPFPYYRPAPPPTVPDENPPLMSATTAKLISNGGSISFLPTLLQGSNVTFSATGTTGTVACASDTGELTGIPNSNTKSVICITATNAYGSHKIWIPVSTYGSTANISQSSGFPFYCDTANRKYTLTEDITANGSAIAIIASNVSLDLNGHTITYNNATPITVPNGSFEVGTGGAATGWDFSNAPNALRFAGTFLYNEIYDGSYSLKFAVTNNNQYVNSTGTVTLEANTTYSLSAMIEYGGQGETENPGVVTYVQLRGTGGESTKELSTSSTNYRGIQHKEFTFTTGGTAETYTIRIGVVGHISSVKPVFVDDIKIQRTKVYGVATQRRNFNTEYYTDLVTVGTGTGATITNGQITQGSDGATFSHGVFGHEITGISVSNVTITVNGASSSTIFALNSTTASNTVVNNTLTSNVTTVTSRDNYDGSVCKGIYGVICNNSITNGCHTGISYTGDSTVAYNTIQMKTKYTNNFALFLSPGCTAYENTILCYTGTYCARGILASGNISKQTVVRNNEIRVKNIANNQEYEGTQLNGVYGIQCDTSGYVTIHDNDVYAYAVSGSDAHCLRFTDINEPVEAYNNNLYAISDGSTGHSSCFSYSNCDGSVINIHDNICVTNDGILGACEYTENAVIADCTITASNRIATAKAYTCDDYPSRPGATQHVAITLDNVTWGDASSQTYAETSTPKYVSKFGGGDASSRMVVSIT